MRATRETAWLSFEELAAEDALFNEMAALTPGIDHYCSSTSWVFSAREAFHPDSEPWIARTPHGYCAFQKVEVRGTRVLCPIEAVWGLATPFVGPDPRPLISTFAGLAARDSDWDYLLVLGIPQTSTWMPYTQRVLAEHGIRVGMDSPLNRWSASLEGGTEGFLARRSPKMRSSLRRDLRRSRRLGIDFERVPAEEQRDVDRIVERIYAIEWKSWKAEGNDGIVSGPMRVFTESALRDSLSRGELELIIATRAKRDLGYIYGALRGSTYRGLQVTFDKRLSRFGLGNQLQFAMIRSLSDRGILRYELGAELPYKKRWSELNDPLCVLKAERSRCNLARRND